MEVIQSKSSPIASLTNSDIQSQYEFLYRAVSDYVDLYKNKEEDYDYSVPVGAVTNNGTTKVNKTHTAQRNFNWMSFQSAKSIQSAKSLKSNGSGPYCVPVGSNGTTSSKSSGSNQSSWYRPGGGSESGGHLYENFVSEPPDKTNSGEIIQAIIHQESLEEEEDDYPHHSPHGSGQESPALECNKTLLSSNSDRTM